MSESELASSSRVMYVKPSVGTPKSAGVPEGNIEAHAPDGVRLVGLEYGEDVHLPLGENARVEAYADFLNGAALNFLGLHDGEVVGRDGDLVAECPALPVLGRGDVLVERDEALLTALPEQGECDDGQTGVGPALEDGCGVGGAEIDIARHEKLEMLAGGCVVYLHIERLLGEEALLLRDIDGDNGQVRLRLVAVHEDDAFGFGLGAGGRGDGERQGERD